MHAALPSCLPVWKLLTLSPNMTFPSLLDQEWKFRAAHIVLVTFVIAIVIRIIIFLLVF